MTEIASSSQNARLKRLAALASTGASLFLSLAKLIVGLIGLIYLLQMVLPLMGHGRLLH